jgi:hypothetical protein
MHHKCDITESQKKTEIIMCYNATKEGTDVMDQISSNYTWPLTFLKNLIDVSGIDAYVVFLKKLYPIKILKQGRSKFLKSVVEKLAAPHIQKRCRSMRKSVVTKLKQRGKYASRAT